MKKIVSILFAIILIFAMLPVAYAKKADSHYQSFLLQEPSTDKGVGYDFETEWAMAAKELANASRKIGFVQIRGAPSIIKYLIDDG